MKKVYCLIFFLLVALNSFSIELIHAAKKDTSKRNSLFVSVAGGMAYTSLFFYRDYEDVTTFTGGYTGRLMLQYNNVIRLSINYTKLNTAEILPVWTNIKNTLVDVEVHFMANVKNDPIITPYIIAGAYAQYWDAFYTGILDRNQWKYFIPPNTNYKRTYYGAALGFGFQFRIIGPLSLYTEFRLRASKTEISSFNLNDNSYGGGIKLNLIGSNHTHHRHHSILRFNKKYHWF